MHFEPYFEIKKQLVTALVLPYFDYVNASYIYLNNALINKLKISQNVCIRYVFILRFDDHAIPSGKQVGWLQVNKILYLSVLTLMHKL